MQFSERIRRFLLILLFVSFIGNVWFAVERWQRNVVVSVPDGDSLQLKDGRRIRLLGIDAPERGRCMADQAREKLVELAQGKRVRLTSTVTDDYGRTLAMVIVKDWPLQRSLLAFGLARNRSSVSNPYHRVLKDATEVAKAAKLGIWSDACRGQTSPREDCTIKGNTRAGKKYYYTPDCPTYEQVGVDTSFGDAWFCSEGEAAKSGFAKAASCR